MLAVFHALMRDAERAVGDERAALYIDAVVTVCAALTGVFGRHCPGNVFVFDRAFDEHGGGLIHIERAVIDIDARPARRLDLRRAAFDVDRPARRDAEPVGHDRDIAVHIDGLSFADAVALIPFRTDARGGEEVPFVLRHINGSILQIDFAVVREHARRIVAVHIDLAAADADGPLAGADAEYVLQGRSFRARAQNDLIFLAAADGELAALHPYDGGMRLRAVLIGCREAAVRLGESTRVDGHFPARNAHGVPFFRGEYAADDGQRARDVRIPGFRFHVDTDAVAVCAEFGLRRARLAADRDGAAVGIDPVGVFRAEMGGKVPAAGIGIARRRAHGGIGPDELHPARRLRKIAVLRLGKLFYVMIAVNDGIVLPAFGRGADGIVIVEVAGSDVARHAQFVAARAHVGNEFSVPDLTVRLHRIEKVGIFLDILVADGRRGGIVGVLVDLGKLRIRHLLV